MVREQGGDPPEGWGSVSPMEVEAVEAGDGIAHTMMSDVDIERVR